MDINKKLQLTFKTANDKSYSINIDLPNDVTDPLLVKAAMDSIISANAISTVNGALVGIKGAYNVTRTVEEIPLV